MDKRLLKNVKYLKGVGPKRAELFEKLGITEVYDLLQYCPRDYIDLTAPDRIRDIRFSDEPVAVRGRIVQKLPPARIRKGMTVCKAVFTDDTDDITLIFYNQEYMFANLKEGEYYVLYGKMTGNLTRKEMSAPQIYPANTPDLLMPVYPLTEGLSQGTVRKAVKSALELVCDGSLEDILPRRIHDELQCCSLEYAWENVHFPKSIYGVEQARKRLIFDELLVYSLALVYRRRNEKRLAARVMDRKLFDMAELTRLMPFELTGDQIKAVNDCVDGMSSGERMTRFIQGDVGCGKTAAVMGAAYFAVKNGCQVCVMAPTEVLAQQHYDTFSSVLGKAGIRIALLTGSLTPKNKSLIQKGIENGEFDIAVGTHALFSQKVGFKSLALVVTDEQHRFGVKQRRALSEKGVDPHVIIMSATPIPRSLAEILYGFMEITQIEQLPNGRKPVKTYAVKGSLRERVFAFVKPMLDAGAQGYIVCAAVDDNGGELIDAQSYSKKLAEEDFSDYSVGLLHGRMSAAQKTRVMSDFKSGKTQLLVATTVVEVGVDVPNAAFIIIENADRFGLAQLHQLRGRVGRGGRESCCILITDNTSEDCIRRMKILCRTNDGFRIADEDLKMRGPGDFFGTVQHGLPPFKIADLARDIEQMKLVRATADRIIKEDPQLERKEHVALRELALELIKKGAQTAE